MWLARFNCLDFKPSLAEVCAKYSVTKKQLTIRHSEDRIGFLMTHDFGMVEPVGHDYGTIVYRAMNVVPTRRLYGREDLEVSPQVWDK